MFRETCIYIILFVYFLRYEFHHEFTEFAKAIRQILSSIFFEIRIVPRELLDSINTWNHQRLE